MMNFIKNNPIIVVVFLGVTIVLVAAILFLGQIRTNQQTPEEAGQDFSSVTSRFTGTSENISISYGGDVDPYQDGVFPKIVVFGLNELTIPEITRGSLRSAITKALAPEIRATTGATYVQVDSKTLNCTDKYDCSFKFYLDSPEGYYSFRLYRNTVGGIETSIVREPLPGDAK